MTAGSGIIHQEMPKGYNGHMGGFQLWVNLPSTHKMMEPRYRAFAYVIEGSGYFDSEKTRSIGKEHLVIYKDGDNVKIVTACF